MDKEEIRKLYNLLIPEIDKSTIENYKYIESREKVHKLIEDMRETIGENGFRKYENLMEEYLHLVHLSNEECFVQGFSKANRFRDESLIR